MQICCIQLSKHILYISWSTYSAWLDVAVYCGNGSLGSVYIRMDAYQCHNILNLKRHCVFFYMEMLMPWNSQHLNIILIRFEFTYLKSPHSSCFLTFLNCLCVFSLPVDDFADDEEVHSFGYKRFGECWAACLGGQTKWLSLLISTFQKYPSNSAWLFYIFDGPFPWTLMHW